MISKQSLDGIKPLAKKLHANGIALEAIENTPVAVLNNTTTVITTTGKDNEKEVELDSQATAEITSVTSGPLPTSHNLEYDNLVAMGIKSVQKQLNIARNQVVPAQQTLVNSVSDILEDKNNDLINKYQVKIETLSQVYRDGNLLAIIEEFKASRVAPVTIIPKLGDIPTEDIIRNYLTTGFTNTDKAIAIWVAEKGAEFFSRVWVDFFNNSLSSDVSDFAKKVSLCKDRALAVFLISRALIDNPPETTNMDLSNFNTLMAAMRNVSGYTLHSHLTNIDSQLRGDLLVLDVSNHVAKVNGDNYDKWLRNGGDVDVILGFIVHSESTSSSPVLTIALLEEQRQKYLNVWYNYTSIAKAACLENKYHSLRSTLMSAFLKYLEDLAGDSSSDLVGDIQGIYKDFKTSLNKLTDDHLRNLHDAVLRLLCNSLYKNTDAYFILSRIEFHMSSNSELKPREAASLATIDYVTDWVFKQLNVVEVIK